MTWNLDNVVTTISKVWTWNIKDITESISILEKYLKISIEYLSSIWLKLLWAIIVLWIWFKVIQVVNNAIEKAMQKAKLDLMIKTFSLSLISILLKIMVFLSAAWVLWIQTTSFLALLTAAWVAIGMSLSWALQNFAWWIIILFFRLYKIGDFISIWENSGTVKSIYIFHTIILTPDKKTIIIPNSQITNWAVINFNTELVRRLDINVWVGYNSDINLVKKVFKELTEQDSRILKWENYETNIFVSWLLDSSVEITIRCFVNSENIFSVKWDLNEKILETCRKNNIEIPFPQRDVHIYNK